MLPRRSLQERSNLDTSSSTGSAHWKLSTWRNTPNSATKVKAVHKICMLNPALTRYTRHWHCAVLSYPDNTIGHVPSLPHLLLRHTSSSAPLIHAHLLHGLRMAADRLTGSKSGIVVHLRHTWDMVGGFTNRRGQERVCLAEQILSSDGRSLQPNYVHPSSALSPPRPFATDFLIRPPSLWHRPRRRLTASTWPQSLIRSSRPPTRPRASSRARRYLAALCVPFANPACTRLLSTRKAMLHS